MKSQTNVYIYNKKQKPSKTAINKLFPKENSQALQTRPLSFISASSPFLGNNCPTVRSETLYTSETGLLHFRNGPPSLPKQAAFHCQTGRISLDKGPKYTQKHVYKRPLNGRNCDQRRTYRFPNIHFLAFTFVFLSSAT